MRPYSGSASVPVMQPADLGDGNDLPVRRRLDLTWDRRVPVQREWERITKQYSKRKVTVGTTKKSQATVH